MILLCPPEKSTQFHYPLDPKKIRAEGSIHKDTTYQGSDRQDFYRHGKKKKKEKKENKQTKRRPRLGLPIGNPVMIGGSLNISLSLGCSSIRCHFSIRICFRLGTDGLNCVTGQYFFAYSCVFLESFLSVREFDFRECFIYKVVWVASRSKA